MQANWVRGNGTGGVLVVAREGSAVNADPSSGTSYTANAAFGSGAQIGTGNYVVYNGTGTNVTVTALTASTTYHYAIYEYNTSGTCYNLTELIGNGTTTVGCTPPNTQAHTFTPSNLQPTQMDIGWTRGNGDNVLVVARQGSAVNADPMSGTSYAANAAFGSGDQIGTGNWVVYNGTGTGVTVTGLMANTTYHYAIYEYLNTDVCYNLEELTGNAITTIPPPAITHTGTSPVSANLNQGSTNNVLYRAQVDVATTAATLTEVIATSGGTWASGDISNFKLWFSTDGTFGSDNMIASADSPGPGNITFTVTPNQAFPIGTRYLFITCDVAAGATVGNTVAAFVDADGDFTYSVAPTYSSSSFAAANLMTIVGTAEIQLQSPVGTNINCGAAALSFGSVTIGNNNSITVRIRNDGSGDLNLTNLPLTLGGSHPGDYSITTQPTSPIAPGGFSDMVVQFMPTTTGTRTANISISNTDGNENPCTVNFTGVGLLANDNCSGATALTVYGSETCGGATSGTTVGATSSGFGTMQCGAFSLGNPDDDVWFSFVATQAEHTITVVGASPLDAVVDLRSGACNGAHVTCVDATAGAGIEIINATGLTSGNTYYVRVYGYGNGNGFGTFTICVTSPVPPLYFRSKQDGNWGDATTWQVSTNNTDWTDASAAPDIDDLDITVEHLVSIPSGTVTIDQLTIAAGQVLDVSAGATLSISNGPGEEDLVVFGILRNAGTVSGAGTRVVKDGGVYQHNYTTTYGVIPTLTWEAGSTCEIVGFTIPTAGGFPTGIGQSFSNFKWNTPSLSQSPNLSGGTINVSGTFTLASTGSAELRLGTNSNGTINTVNYEQTGGTLNCAAGDGNGTINISGNFNQTGGTINESSSGSGSIVFNGSNQTFTKTGGTISNTINFTVNSSSTLDVGTSVITGTGAFTLTSGATLITANPDGIFTPDDKGSIQTTTKNFDSAANYEFQGASTGVFTTTPLGTTINNLTINRTGGDVSLAQTLTVSGTTTLTAGRLNLNGFTLTFTGQIGGLPAWGNISAKYIIATTGSLSTIDPATTLYPVGTATQYLPCRLSGTGVYGVHLSATSTGLSIPSLALPTQWNISGSGTLNMDYQWPSDVFGTTTNLYKYDTDDMVWSKVAGPVMATVPGNGPLVASFTGISCCSGFTVGAESALPVDLAYFRATPADGKTLLDWRTYSETNNAYFSIEKSTDGKRYSELGQVEGKGFSYEINDYGFVDEKPAPGINYYRLRQVDFDGQFEYSKVVSVHFSGGKGEVLLYPTVASSEVQIRFPSPTEAAGFVQVFDLNGRLVKQLAFESEMDGLTLPTHDLPNGQYLVRVQNGQVFEVLRFVKQ